MRQWAAIVACAVACASSDDDADSDPTDTDAPDDTDTQTSDTDTPGDTDTNTPTDDELDCTFQKCGGDVVGEWTIDGVCFPDLGNPFGELCSTSTYTFNYDTTGTVSIHKDGTFEASYVSTLRATGTFPPECNSGILECSDWNAAQAGMVCTGDVAVQCDCVLTVGPFPEEDSGLWAYEGENVVFAGLGGGGSTPDGGEDFTTYAYCQDGDSLRLQVKGGLPIQFVLSR